MTPRVHLYSRPGCHLCDDARALVAATCGTKVAWEEIDISADASLTSRYGEQIPVVTVDDAVVGFWRIDPDRLKAALKAKRRR
ncbi:glutaredoxin family protein [Demequina sp. NBRC 110051]|uniref:glutaredoxin family protein n=1 Tax=Demequina sp. NBRC 110051 TaxID=1570340 RepID=UPI0009FF9797|nr:glutaredoxin family protein [Demequina sp. NBRC 110051]